MDKIFLTKKHIKQNLLLVVENKVELMKYATKFHIFGYQ